jgi:predicted ArsR family transcriptional regulator
MTNASPEDVLTRLHEFGLARDRLRTAMAGVLSIGMTDLDALEYLERYGPMTQRELAGWLMVTSGAVTMLVDRLEALGLVRRGAHPTDRRASLVHAEANTALPDLPEVVTYHQALAQAANALSAAGRTQLRGFLEAAATQATESADAMRARTPPRARAR